jgi:tetratricopeptide (TPR) repeat protein
VSKGPHWLLLVVTLGACSATRPPEYASRSSGAEKAYSAGRYREAGELWLGAAETTSTPRLRIEAKFRAAASYERARDFVRARELYDQIAAIPAPNERAARAAFASADIEIEHGNVERGHARLARALLEHPGSGAAPTALNRHVTHLRKTGGSEAVLRYLEELTKKLGDSELGEAAAYARARELDRLGTTLEARDAYLEIARRFPYPHGAFWDDALYRAAERELDLGRPEAALSHLERMLEQREQARMQGSYERTRYAEARFLIAEIYRDKLKQPERARLEFRKVWSDHPTSLLADDALWNEAITASRTDGGSAACAPLEILVSKLPDSRFAPCATKLCPSLSPPPAGQCHAYLMREVSGSAEER